ncbi:MAG TPA: peptidoglycan DD-metalloendopeptidase family protein [Actinoplanes sp.]|nr:peptidoglycan DD-metalloendopeptidase family protein [Actinoplanes sp.]
MRIPVAVAAALLLLTAPTPGSEPTAAESPAPTAGGDALVAAVTARALDPAGPTTAAGTPSGRRLRVDVQPRSTADWGIGAAVLPSFGLPDAYPRAWIFIAQRVAGRWRVALEGEPAFRELGAAAPILSAAERRILSVAGTAAAGTEAARAGTDSAGTEAGGQGGGGTTTRYGDRRTVIGLPYAEGQSWKLAAGPHSMSSSGPRSSLDLTGGDGIVRAAADGVAYTLCGGRGWIRILHARGFATDYYHLRGNIDVSGRRVTAGTFLGRIGNDVSCGGWSSGAHVHFALLRGGQYLPLDGYAVGGWTVHTGRSPRTGTLRRGSRVARVGGYLRNYGPQALNQGVVDAAGRRAVPLRSGPSHRSRIIDWLPDGATVSVRCSVRGQAQRGRSPYGTNLWNRLVSGGYVGDAFLATGTSGPVRGYCP